MAKSDNDLPDDEFQKKYSKPEVREPVPTQEEQDPKPEIREPEIEAPPPDHPPPESNVLPLTDLEILEVRWVLWGQCPSCGELVRGWNPGPFHAQRYTKWQEQGIHVLSGHKESCLDKNWRRQA